MVSSGIVSCPRDVVPGMYPTGPMKLDGYENHAPSMRVVPRFPHNGVQHLALHRHKKTAAGGSGFKLNINYDSILISY